MAKGLRAMWRMVTVAMLLLGMSCTAVHAANVYVRQGATGANNGTDWTNAFGSLPSTLVRGNTYYIADGNYGSRIFNTPVSGTALITIKKATSADHGTEAGWSSTFGDGQATFSNIEFHTSNWVINGQTRNTDWKSGYGFKVASGGSGHKVLVGIPFQTPVSNVTLQYVEVQGSGDTSGTIFDRGIYVTSGCSNILVSKSYIHDVGESTMMVIDTNGITIEHTWIARNGAGPGVHSEGLVLRDGASNVVFRYNVMEDIGSTAYIGTPTVGHPGCGGTVQSNWYFYGNVFTRGAGTRGLSPNGILVVFDHRITGDFYFVNNTIIGFNASAPANIGMSVGGGGDGCADTLIAQNNLFVNVTAGGVSSGNVASPVFTHNAFWSSSNVVFGTNTYVASGDPLVGSSTGNFRLTPTAASAMATGIPLASPYNINVDGLIRGLDGKWDRGAFEFGGTTAGSIPQAPASLLVQ